MEPRSAGDDSSASFILRLRSGHQTLLAIARGAISIEIKAVKAARNGRLKAGDGQN